MALGRRPIKRPESSSTLKAQGINIVRYRQERQQSSWAFRTAPSYDGYRNTTDKKYSLLTRQNLTVFYEFHCNAWVIFLQVPIG